MRLVSIVSTLLLLVAHGARAVAPGDPVESVLEEMGLPGGQIEVGATRILFYERGQIVLSGGHVASHTVVSTGEFARRQRLAAEKNAEMIRLAKERRASREAEGLVFKQSKLSDDRFAGLPAVERLAFWKVFQERYPMVSIERELSSALTEYEAERLLASNNALSRRVSELEVRLQRAESNLYQSRRTSGFGYWGGALYGGRGYSGRLNSRSPYRPPGRRPEKQRPNHDFNSRKGTIMSTMDRARGSYDSSYSRSRAAFYARITP